MFLTVICLGTMGCGGCLGGVLFVVEGVAFYVLLRISGNMTVESVPFWAVCLEMDGVGWWVGWAVMRVYYTLFGGGWSSGQLVVTVQKMGEKGEYGDSARSGTQSLRLSQCLHIQFCHIALTRPDSHPCGQRDDVLNGLGPLVAPHRAIPLFDPPADQPLTAVVRAIQTIPPLV